MNKFFGPFLVHFPNFWDKKIIQENPTLSHTTLAPYKNLEKTNDAIPRKRLDRRTDGRTDGWKDRQTLFHRTLPATARGPIKIMFFQV